MLKGENIPLNCYKMVHFEDCCPVNAEDAELPSIWQVKNHGLCPRNQWILHNRTHTTDLLPHDLVLLKFFSNLQHILPEVSESDNSKIIVAISKRHCVTFCTVQINAMTWAVHWQCITAVMENTVCQLSSLLFIVLDTHRQAGAKLLCLGDNLLLLPCVSSTYEFSFM